MHPSPEQTISSFRRTMARVRRESNTPEKARQLLLRIGLLEKDKKSPHGVRIARRYR